MPNRSPFIEFRGVTKRFGSRTVLDGVDLSIFEGEVTTVIGKSGVGKSVLLKHIIGLLLPDEGEVLIRGRSVGSMSRKELRSLKREISYMFQHNALFDSMTVFENIALPLRQSTDLSESEVRERVMRKIEDLEIAEVHDRYPSQLSGGMQKRVALGRALITEPEVVLFDEPTTGLDPIRKNSVLTMIARYQRSFGFTAVLVSHDIPDVFYISDRTALIEDGRILFQGSPLAIEQSAHPVVALFTRSLTLLRDDLAGLLSRDQLEERFNRETVQGGILGAPFTTFLFTIENLDMVGSMAGSLSAQRIVQSIARFLTSRLEPSSWCGRLEIDKILCIVPGFDRANAERRLEELAQEMMGLEIFRAESHPGVCINFSVQVRLAEGTPGTDLWNVVESLRSNGQNIARLVCGNLAQELQ
jgi:phospholipid/cholesterol/gamma-HCH transport system ATP-binding protein